MVSTEDTHGPPTLRRAVFGGRLLGPPLGKCPAFQRLLARDLGRQPLHFERSKEASGSAKLGRVLWASVPAVFAPRGDGQDQANSGRGWRGAAKQALPGDCQGMRRERP